MASCQALMPEVALLDIGMPRTRWLRSGAAGAPEFPRPRGDADRGDGLGPGSDKARALAAGFNHHFTKPVEPDRLSELLAGPIA